MNSVKFVKLKSNFGSLDGVQSLGSMTVHASAFASLLYLSPDENGDFSLTEGGFDVAKV